MSRIAGRFARVEPRLRAKRLVLGLLSDLPRKNCWTIAEWAGEATPHGMQHLLCRAAWDAEAVRDDVREYVVEHLHDEAAVLVVDETGDVKKAHAPSGSSANTPAPPGGSRTPRSPSTSSTPASEGTRRWTESLYIPRSWTCDPDRCQAAGLTEPFPPVRRERGARLVMHLRCQVAPRTGAGTRAVSNWPPIPRCR